MNKIEMVSEVWAEQVESAQREFKGKVREYLTLISRLTADLERAKKEFAALEFVEPKLPDLS